MVTGFFVIAALSLVVVAVQFSCLISHQEPKKEAEAPVSACSEA